MFGFLAYGQSAYGVTLSVGGGLSLTGIPSSEAFGSLMISFTNRTVTFSGIASLEAHGTPTIVEAGKSLFPDSIASAEAFGSPTLTTTATITLTGIASAEAFGLQFLTAFYLDVTHPPVGALRATVLNSAGTVIGGAPLYTLAGLSRSMPMDQIGSASFTIPATDPLTAYVTEGNHVKLYHKTGGYLGEYIIQSATIDVSGRTLTAQCVSILQELVWANALFRRRYNNIAVSSVISTANISGNLYGLLYGTGWTPGTVDAGLGNITVTLEGETIYQSIDAVRKRLGKHFREGATARTLDFGAFGTDGGYRLIKPELITNELADVTQATNIGLIESLAIESETSNLVNRVIPFGAGQGLAALTIEKNTRLIGSGQMSGGGETINPNALYGGTGTNPDGSTYYYLENPDSVAAYGLRVAPLVKSDIVPISNSDADLTNAANALYDVAAVYLARNSVKTVVYRATVRRCPSGIKAGDKIRAVYRGLVTTRGSSYKWVDVNALLWIHEISETYDAAGAPQVSLTLGTTEQLPLDDSGVVLGMLQEIQIGKTHVQPYPSEFNDTFEEELDPTHSVTATIDIDARTLFVNACSVRFVARPLRATFSTAASGGNSTQTTVSINRTTADNESLHYHTIKIYGGGPAGAPVYENYGFLNKSGGEAQVTTYGNADPHTHGMSHSHTVSIPAHTHPLTFGVTDDTQYPTGIRVTVDGTDRTVALGGPWSPGSSDAGIVIDLTTYLVNATGGLRQRHTVTFSCAGGQGKIRVTTKALTTTQAIAVTM